MEAPRITGERVVLRAMTDGDVPRIAEIRALPGVARWWPPRDDDYLAAKLDGSELACWVVELEADVVGYVQAYEEVRADCRHAGLDVFLDPAVHGHGLGQEVLRLVAHHLVDDRGHHRLVIDPAAQNARAIRCFEAVGFRRVGILRSYWWDHVENRWADGLLMDLRANELG